jgi:hypothetical protein
MLGGVDLVREGFEGIGGFARHAGLSEVGAAVDLGVDPMDGAPASGTPAFQAWPMPSKPGKAGSRLGWRLMIRPANASSRGALMTRMKPASTTRSTCAAFRSSAQACSRSGANFVLNGPVSREAGGDAVLRAELQHLAAGDVAPESDHLGLAQAAVGLGAEDRVGVGAATGTEEGDAHEGKVPTSLPACKRIFDFNL